MAARLPADIFNRALDAIGADTIIGDFSDGTRESEIASRLYGRLLRELLRAAHWNFARKQDTLLLLADASGQTFDPLNNPYPTDVEAPWLYSYAWPSDGIAARWLPWSQNQTIPTMPPLVTNLQATTGLLLGQYPARFLVSSTEQFPAISGSVDWDALPNLPEGQGLISRKIILTNVPNAAFVYTKLVLDPEEWDALFEQAFVACLASRSAMSVLEDKKRAMQERAAQVSIAKEALTEARTRNANEAGFPQSINRVPDWIRARRYGSSRWGAAGLDGGGFGVLGYDWSPMSMADGSVF